MITILTSALLLAAPSISAAKPASGLISTGQMTVRAVVEDRCTVGTDGATCAGSAPIRPLAVTKAHEAPRIDIVF